jgi:hypothetical protein
VFRNVGIQKSDDGEIPKRIHTRFKTRGKFEIKKGNLNKTRHFFGIEGKEGTQLKTLCVCIVTAYSATALMVYLNCEMRSRVTIKREK